ncbi:hypothetical protein EFS13_01505 [Lentilactobacillus buchneri]|nr:hypothetical protein [Lentilactobacillus buchneri]MCT3547186.1 hypothetical protein [Lentilactobacillus buchneri]MCT3554235.1 hypothetical protein [Lentilactobacillus buchneri]MCT3561051.1 hypothetical protein [Lentilactobacillus buchneri]MCT3563449.1 hypothetical protein [Lentilactobacillus buchneri]
MSLSKKVAERRLFVVFMYIAERQYKRKNLIKSNTEKFACKIVKYISQKSKTDGCKMVKYKI